jgi:hypothetical protein
MNRALAPAPCCAVFVRTVSERTGTASAGCATAAGGDGGAPRPARGSRRSSSTRASAAVSPTAAGFDCGAAGGCGVLRLRASASLAAPSRFASASVWRSGALAAGAGAGVVGSTGAEIAGADCAARSARTYGASSLRLATWAGASGGD